MAASVSLAAVARPFLNGAKNSAVLRHIALNLLKREALAKRRSLKCKHKKAAWDEQYPLKGLVG